MQSRTLAIYAFVAAAASSSASACPPPNPPAAPFPQQAAATFQYATAVFEATVVSYSNSSVGRPDHKGRIETRLKPIQTYKGQATGEALKFTVELTGSTCDKWPNYGVGSKVLVMTMKAGTVPVLFYPADGEDYQEAVAVVRQLSQTAKP